MFVYYKLSCIFTKNLKTIKMVTTEKLTEAIETAKLEYISDISWSYSNTINPHCIKIMFDKDETGKNEVYEFEVKVKGTWITLEPTNKQLKLMFQMLNDVPYKEVETFNEVDDEYFENGVKREDFY